MKHAPDIVVKANGPYEFAGTIHFKENQPFSKNKIRRDHTGSHDEDGILLINGKEIENKTVSAHIVDLLPTILWYLGLPVPDYMEGKVITDIFSQDFCKNNPVKQIHFEENKPHQEKNIPDENKKIEDRLKSLGYL